MPSKRSRGPGTHDRGGSRGNRITTRMTGVASDDTPESRIGQLIAPQRNGCWLFRGKADRYGLAKVNGRNVRVHRYVYEILVGPIPEDADVHHECETPGCCNPAHLVALSRSEHKLRHSEMKRAG